MLARVLVCETNGLDAALPENPLVTFDIADMSRRSPIVININTIIAVVGRIHLQGNEWAIVDRSRDCARPQFTDDDGDIQFE